MTLDRDTWLQTLSRANYLPDAARAAFVVGSTARGWDNRRSDVDVYVVTRGIWDSPTAKQLPVPLTLPQIQTESFADAGRRWEVSYWTEIQVEEIFQKVETAAIDVDVIAGAVLTAREELFLARLATAIPLAGAHALEAWQQRLTDSKFRELLTRRSLNLADAAAEDALGQLESGQNECAVVSARRAFEFTIDALLEKAGEFGSPIPKWQPNRLQNVRPVEISFELYWATITLRGYDDAEPGQWVTQVLMLCQQLALDLEAQ